MQNDNEWISFRVLSVEYKWHIASFFFYQDDIRQTTEGKQYKQYNSSRL